MRLRTIMILGFLLFFVVIPAAGFGVFFWRFQAHPPTPNYAVTDDPVEARRQDLDYLLNLPTTDRSFSIEEAERFKAHVGAMQGRADTMTPAEFAMGVAAGAAITNNGHTNLYRRDMLAELNSLPLRFYWFGDGLHIVRAREAYADLIGARVVRYDGFDPEEFVDRLAPYFGGNKAFRHYNSVSFLASPDAMHAAGLITDSGKVTLTLVLKDGSERIITIEPETVATPMMSPDDGPLSMPVTQETDSGNAWVYTDLEAVSRAQFGRFPEVLHWTEDLPEGGMYIRMRLIWDQDERKISSWLADIKERLSENPVDYLVVDLRSTFGGDYTKARDFAVNILDLVVPDGKVYLLTDGGTFSAAIVTLAFALHAAGDRGIVVGTAIGDDEQFWAEGGGSLTLPNSGMRIWVTTGYHDWENGCTDWSTCFWLNIIMGVAAGPLDPDIVAPLNYADYAAGIDTTLQAVFKAEGIGGAVD